MSATVLQISSWMESYREKIKEIAQQHRANHIRLFGSQARGDAKKRAMLIF